ncbi:MFS transporter [Paenibacillus piri]|uniref:MFS transporter n=1 Tax=Paenibacillus piri TaxID=2547395 RepID=A0A4V2ZSI3_9BACL|nr:MFS transporter [Paenibacillus piri]TDF93304.1 MFS transporter [Paenibacillus piri]
MLPFLLYYIVIYMANAVYGTFIPVYFQSVGITPAQIGSLLSIGPLIALFAQPVWGSLGDRAKSKNSVLRALIIGTGLIILLFPVSSQFYYLLVMVCLFTFFQTSIGPISDAITLEQLDKQKRWSFGPIRLGGTIGFAAMSLFFGWIAKNHIDFIFIVYALIMFVSVMLLSQFPSATRFRSADRKMNIAVLFKHRKLMIYMGINLVLHTMLGYYYSFFPVYFHDIGGSSLLLGWSMVISAVSEIPFLLFSGRIMKRFKVIHILLVAGIASTLRWFAFSLTDNPYWVLPAQVLHGLIFIVLSVTMAMYINQEVPAELKASGQTLNALVSAGIARIAGSFFGGLAIEAYGIKPIFYFNGWLAAACTGFIVWLCLKERASDRRADANRAVGS